MKLQIRKPSSWKTIIPLLKSPFNGEKINLIENGKNISNDPELCNISNGFFSNITPRLYIPKKVSMFSKLYGFNFSSLHSQRIQKSPKY